MRAQMRKPVCLTDMIVHIDLFSGIGGFAYAADNVFGDVEHIFCDNEPFARQVLHKHWPEAYIYDDIRAITNTGREHGEPWGAEIGDGKTKKRNAQAEKGERFERPFILTGGFPCQPFSAAGLRHGTADDRHLWPEMLRVIRLTKPTWVIAENVRGITNWNDGVVFEQVCADLEASGYEVQPFIIPAVAVNAPHRRDRVWFVAHAVGSPNRRGTSKNGSKTEKERVSERNEMGQSGKSGTVRDVTDTPGNRRQRPRAQTEIEKGRTTESVSVRQLSGGFEGQNSWNRPWSEVAAELCSVDDGLPAELDGLKLSKPQHRAQQLKAYGNAIVPQVAMEIMLAIRESIYQ